MTERKDGGRKESRRWEDGNSRNGYHKVKCQVPETEELGGREKKEEKMISNQAKTTNSIEVHGCWLASKGERGKTEGKSRRTKDIPQPFMADFETYFWPSAKKSSAFRPDVGKLELWGSYEVRSALNSAL